MDLTGKTLLLIGGTGSFGSAFLHHLLATRNELGRIIIFSRDEQKQFELSTTLAPDQKKKVKFMIGDVRDRWRVDEAMNGVHVVVYAAAMKNMPIAEANPEECFKTNIQGTQNVVDVALIHQVEKLVALSTDKAVLPINVYGASKLFLERIAIHANSSPRNKGTKLCAVRYANVLGSRGSVVPFFQKMKSTGVLPITDMRMTRFSITLQQSIGLVEHALEFGLGGETFVPRTPSYKIKTVAEAVAPECKLKEVGMRSGEKLSEILVSRFESPRTVETDQYYVVLPEDGSIKVDEYIRKLGGKPVAADFEYDSSTNTEWLSAEEIRSQMANLPS